MYIHLGSCQNTVYGSLHRNESIIYPPLQGFGNPKIISIKYAYAYIYIYPVSQRPLK